MAHLLLMYSTHQVIWLWCRPTSSHIILHCTSSHILCTSHITYCIVNTTHCIYGVHHTLIRVVLRYYIQKMGHLGRFWWHVYISFSFPMSICGIHHTSNHIGIHVWAGLRYLSIWTNRLYSLLYLPLLLLKTEKHYEWGYQENVRNNKAISLKNKYHRRFHPKLL